MAEEASIQQSLVFSFIWRGSQLPSAGLRVRNDEAFSDPLAEKTSATTS